MTEIEYELREEDILAFNEHRFLDSESLKKTIRRHQATIPAVMSLVALIYWAVYQDFITGVFIAVIGIAWGLLVPVYLRSNLKRQIKGKYSEQEKADIVGKYKLRIEPDVLVEVSDDEDFPTPWSKLLRVESNKDYAFIFTDINAALIVPKKTVISGNIKDFIARVDKHITAAE